MKSSRGLWVVAMSILIVTTFARWRGRVPSPSANLTIPVVHPGQPARDDTTLESLCTELVASDPFRLGRTPSLARYGSGAAVSTVVSQAVREPRPAMTLKAIAGGPPWQALIDGVPGHANALLVQPGTVLDRFRIGAITRTAVVVRGPDTTWVLSFASPR